MEIRHIKKLIIVFLILLKGGHVLCQINKNDSTPLIVIKDIVKENYRLGDTIKFTLKNQSLKDREYYIEVSTSYSESLKIGYDAVYTAYFNKDVNFLKKISRLKQLSSSKGTRYILPDVEAKYYLIKANQEKEFRFILKGKELNKGLYVQLKIMLDYRDEEPEFFIRVKPFYLFVNP